MASEALRPVSGQVRPCGDQDRQSILEIVNAAAAAYRGVIPADRWHEPYMPAEELEAEIAAGVRFAGFYTDRLTGVMGVQAKANVELIRHAYVRPGEQGRGVGAALLGHLRESGGRQMLVGTWRAASWAIRFYQRHGFSVVAEDDIAPLLRTYWSVPDRQIETSVVLPSPALSREDVRLLIDAAAVTRPLTSDG